MLGRQDATQPARAAYLRAPRAGTPFEVIEIRAVIEQFQFARARGQQSIMHRNPKSVVLRAAEFSGGSICDGGRRCGTAVIDVAQHVNAFARTARDFAVATLSSSVIGSTRGAGCLMSAAPVNAYRAHPRRRGSWLPCRTQSCRGPVACAVDRPRPQLAAGPVSRYRPAPRRTEPIDHPHARG